MTKKGEYQALKLKDISSEPICKQEVYYVQKWTGTLKDGKWVYVDEPYRFTDYQKGIERLREARIGIEWHNLRMITVVE